MPTIANLATVRATEWQRPSHVALADFVTAETTVGAAPLVPDLRLHLATAARDIFLTAEALMDGRLGSQPYWAFAWPGGQGLARYIIDHASLVAGRRVLDIGAGSAIGAIAALKAGAARALAADIDPLAVVAARMNGVLNGVPLEVSSADLLGTLPDADVVLIGDLVYEPDLLIRVGAFIEAAAAAGRIVLYGDRTSARRPRQPFRLLAEYDAPLMPPLVDDFRERARVWQLGGG
jgi:predicted nicotinamide N-methyase